jgi:hypothetical protein
MIRLRVYKRQAPLGWGTCLVFLIALGAALGICSLLLAIQGKPSGRGMWLLFKAAFFSPWAVED